MSWVTLFLVMSCPFFSPTHTFVTPNAPPQASKNLLKGVYLCSPPLRWAVDHWRGGAPLLSSSTLSCPLPTAGPSSIHLASFSGRRTTCCALCRLPNCIHVNVFLSSDSFRCVCIGWFPRSSLPRGYPELQGVIAGCFSPWGTSALCTSYLIRAGHHREQPAIQRGDTKTNLLLNCVGENRRSVAVH